MHAADAMQAISAQNRKGLALSVIGHGLLLLAFGSSVELFPRQPMTRLAIDAVVVADTNVPAQPLEDPRQKEAEQQRKDMELQKQQEQKELEAAEQERRQEEQLVAKKEAAELQKREAEAVALAEKQRQQKEADVAAQRKEQERKAAEEKARVEQERKAAEEQAKIDAKRRDQERRQAELLASMAAEEELSAARNSGELSRYLALIQQKVVRNWSRPPSARGGLVCEVAVVQLPSGEVVDARTVSCNGDEAVQRSVENAVRKASPLPLPDNRALFERNLRFVFKPEQ